jgi:hypothetical protein
MKQLFLVLIITGAIQTNLVAQNYRICRINNQYRVCDIHTPLFVASAQTTADNSRAASASMRSGDTYTRMITTTPGLSAKRNKRILVGYDDPGGGYSGKETMINDGVEKNKNRNINSNNTSVNLPASDGSMR